MRRAQPEINMPNDVSSLTTWVISCVLNADSGRYADALVSCNGPACILAITGVTPTPSSRCVYITQHSRCPCRASAHAGAIWRASLDERLDGCSSCRCVVSFFFLWVTRRQRGWQRQRELVEGNDECVRLAANYRHVSCFSCITGATD